MLNECNIKSALKSTEQYFSKNFYSLWKLCKLYSSKKLSNQKNRGEARDNNYDSYDDPVIWYRIIDEKKRKKKPYHERASIDIVCNFIFFLQNANAYFIKIPTSELF